MTIISHRYKSGANTSDVSLAGRNPTAELWVESNDPEDTGLAVITYLIAQGFVYGAAYNVGNDDLTSRTPVNTGLYQIEPPQLAPGSATTWSVVLRYRQITPQLQTIAGTISTSPLTRRPVITTNTTTRSILSPRGIYRGGFDLKPGFPNGLGWTIDTERVITNSAEVPYNPPPEEDFQNRIIRISRNFPSVVVDRYSLPINWINKTTVTFTDYLTRITIQPYQLKFLAWITTPKFENDINYVEVVFEGEIQESGWRLKLQDKGFMERTESYYPAAEKKVKILDDEEQPISEPVLLDGAGRALAEGGTPRYGTWSIYDEIDPRTYAFFTGISS